MRRRNLVLFGVSALVACALACSSAKPATPVAPTSSGPTAATDGSTLKTSAPALQSPSNGARLTSTTVVLTAGASTPQFAAGVPLQYRFQVMNPAGTVVAQALVGSPTWTVTPELTAFNTNHTWRVRAEYLGEAGPWSNTMSFITVEPFLINDPAYERHDGRQRNRRRVRCRAGWQSRSLTDGIDYDVPTCVQLQARVRPLQRRPHGRVARSNGISRLSRWATPTPSAALAPSGITPGRCTWCSERTSPPGWEIIWRNGGTDTEGDPGDHRIKLTDVASHH